MLKAKKYDWKDSNLALFGSDTEKQVKKSSAETEPAWKSAGSGPGLQIWRIVNFKVTNWDKDEYGNFFSGDSYIILNTYTDPESDALMYDVHFWIGKYSTQDEYGTAAYKTVELDTFLDDKAIQHREVQEYESALFRSYFDKITYLSGGADSGFRRVKPEEYVPRLLQFKGTTIKDMVITELECFRENLNSEDVFILDKGLEIIQFNGKSCDKDEKFKAAQYIQQLRSDRNGKPKVEQIDENQESEAEEFYQLLPSGEKSVNDHIDLEPDRCMFKLSDASGSLEMVEVEFARDSLTSDDVFIVNNGRHCYVWIGSGASIDERRNAMSYGHSHLMKYKNPMLPISVVSQGKEPTQFASVFDN